VCDKDKRNRCTKTKGREEEEEEKGMKEEEGVIGLVLRKNECIVKSDNIVSKFL
jgi:hypothetical protein